MTSLFPRSEDAFNVTTRSNGCVAFDPSAKLPTYGYVPHLEAGIIYTIAFAIIFTITTWQTIRSRKWWYLALVLGVLGELIGWAGRIGAHYCPYNGTVFSLQISILIIAPCFYSAALYYILSQLINQHGRAYSPISARFYLIIFSTADLISIAIQGTGGGLAASAGSKVPPQSSATGTHIMLAGIAIQLASMAIFCLLWFYFLYAARTTAYSRTLAYTVTFSATCIMIRNVYRAVELGQGFDGYLSYHEAYFSVLDASFMVFAPAILNIFWPARYVDGVPRVEDVDMKGLDQSKSVPGSRSGDERA